MSYTSISLLLSLAASGIVSAWLYYRLKVSATNLALARSELDTVTRRRAELAAEVISLRGSLEKSQESAWKYYDKLSAYIKSSAKPGTPGSVDKSIGFLRQAFTVDTVDGDSTIPVRPAPGTNPDGEPDKR